jgi:hypothetical protein
LKFITLCPQFWELEVGCDLIGSSFLLLSIWYSTQEGLVVYWARKLPKMNIEGEIFKSSLFTNNFKLEDGFWPFIKIRKQKWGLSGHLLNLLYLINICRRYLKSKSFFLTSIICMVCTCCKWASIGLWIGGASLCLLFILELLILPLTSYGYSWM